MIKPSRSEFLTVRGLRTHVRHWGAEGAPKIFMLHGWMDAPAPTPTGFPITWPTST
jgi:pimeloyl-ACP methyl ester carboxylesterase